MGHEERRSNPWPAERLDDLARSVRALEPVATAVATLAVTVDEMHGDVRAILEQQREDRRANRNALIAFAAPVTAAIVSGAVALIVAFL